MIEQARTNIFSNTNNMMNDNWVRIGASLTSSNDFPLYAAGGNVYCLKGDGSWNAHQFYRMFTSHLITISVYRRQHTAVWAQLATSTALHYFCKFQSE